MDAPLDAVIDLRARLRVVGSQTGLLAGVDARVTVTGDVFAGRRPLVAAEIDEIVRIERQRVRVIGEVVRHRLDGAVVREDHVVRIALDDDVDADRAQVRLHDDRDVLRVGRRGTDVHREGQPLVALAPDAVRAGDPAVALEQRDRRLRIVAIGRIRRVADRRLRNDVVRRRSDAVRHLADDRVVVDRRRDRLAYFDVT